MNKLHAPRQFSTNLKQCTDKFQLIFLNYVKIALKQKRLRAVLLSLFYNSLLKCAFVCLFVFQISNVDLLSGTVVGKI